MIVDELTHKTRAISTKRPSSLKRNYQMLEFRDKLFLLKQEFGNCPVSPTRCLQKRNRN
jgi:hypothetical protein